MRHGKIWIPIRPSISRSTARNDGTFVDPRPPIVVTGPVTCGYANCSAFASIMNGTLLIGNSATARPEYEGPSWLLPGENSL
jgi:hypothetical protein